MSASLNPTELPAIASQVGVYIFFSWKLVIAFKDLASKNWAVHQEEANAALAVPVPREHLCFVSKLWGRACFWYLACILFTQLIPKPVLRGCFGWTSQKETEQGCSRDFTYFSMSGLEDRMGLFIHHQFPAVLSRTDSQCSLELILEMQHEALVPVKSSFWMLLLPS